MNELIFNGKSFSDFNAYVATSNFLDGAQKDVESIAIPGRSGELQLDNRRFHNMTIRTTVYITGNMQQNMAAMRNYLNSCGGYCRYEENLDPDHYRMASFTSAFEPYVYDRNGGAVILEFNAYPQRWLKSGETAVSFTANGTITNPTLFASEPLLRVYGKGNFIVNNTQITISDFDTYTDIDCDLMECHKGTTDCSEFVTISGNNFPTLQPGSNQVLLGSGITMIEITPRWFVI